MSANRDSGIAKKSIGMLRAANQGNMYRDPDVVLCKVWDSTLVVNSNPDPSASKYVWRYRVSPAKISFTGLGVIPSTAFLDHPTPADPQPLYYAFSASELGNTQNLYSYGQDPANFPAGIVPIKIPDLTPVVCLAQQIDNTNGDFIYIIINTQAIGGPCV